MKIREAPSAPLARAAAPAAASEGRRRQTGREEFRPGVSEADRGEWSAEAQELLRSGRMWEALDRLQTEHQGISMVIVERQDAQSLRQQALALGPGRYLLLTEDFLQQMQTGEEALRAGLERITRALGRLEGQNPAQGAGALLDAQSGVFWQLDRREDGRRPSAAVPAPKAEENGASAFENFRLSVNLNQLLRSPSRILTRIASARSVFDVQNAQLWARRAISELKFAEMMGDEKLRTRIRTAVRRLEKACRNGSRKIDDIQRIELLKKQKQRAEERMERERARRAESQLNQNRTERRRKDRGLRKEASEYEFEQAFAGDAAGASTGTAEVGGAAVIDCATVATEVSFSPE